jgi:hypothetical protein
MVRKRGEGGEGSFSQDETWWLSKIFLFHHGCIYVAFSMAEDYRRALEMYRKSLNWKQTMACGQLLSYDKPALEQLAQDLFCKLLKYEPAES